MIIGAIDTETTGLLSPDHRIIEVYIDLLHNGKSIFKYEQRIDPQRSISADAQAIHRISMSDLLGKPVWNTVAPVVQKVLSKCDGYLWHNGDEFDGPFLEMELKRVGLEMPKRPSIDTMTKGVWATPDGKKPRLSELCFACGVPYDPTLAHAAAYDVDRMIECYDKGKAWGFYPADFAQETAQGS